MLELSALNRDIYVLGKLKGLVDIGCGAFTLDECALLTQQLKDVPAYYGQDVSPKALTRAMYGTAAHFDQVTLILADLTQHIFVPRDVEGHYVLTRRVVQNLEPEHQARVAVRLMTAYPHGLMIERTELDHANVNMLRRDLGKTALPIPCYNFYLKTSLMEQICKMPCNVSYPMADYFYLTRVTESIPKGDLAAWRREAGKLRTVPDMGPAFIAW